MSEMYDSPQSPRMTRAVQWLLALNIGVYFLQLTLFGSDAVYSTLALDPARFPTAWWTVGTYMFVHAWLAHLAFNMFTLWMFGPRLEQEWGTRTFVQFYLWCGLGGAIAHLLFAQHSAVIGASGAISGVLVAYALRWHSDAISLARFGDARDEHNLCSVAGLADRLDSPRRRDGFWMDLPQAVLSGWHQSCARLGVCGAG